LDPEIERLLDLASRVPSNRRSEFLSRLCPDPAIRADVESLLKYATASETYFEDAVQDLALALTSGELLPGYVVGDYKLVRIIGRGGMGSVYLAERAGGELSQKVAIKFLRGDILRKSWRERFLKERELLASLNHPSIVHVLDAGHNSSGRPFLVMEYVEGIDISAFADALNVRDRVRLFLGVCEGVSHAHRRLVIHRDLKPSNILVNEDGQPKLLDFGLARLLSEPQDATQTIERMLTRDYASPEQLAGLPQTTATDVYSLGAVLYRLLTGMPPRDHADDLRRSVITAPSRINSEVRDDFDFILHKALRDKPEERYASVDEFASDLRAALE
jgi:serine/threonine protein kinase